jgi:gamma-glutamylcyclotransferase (GGCT)/AIG2-like uncharacterized protein YtfP
VQAVTLLAESYSRRRYNTGVLYAAFGSNLDRDQMRTRCPGARVVGPGVLRGWMPSFGGPSPRRGCGVATVVPGDGDVPVLVYDIPERDWAELDRCEGHPHFYERVLIDVIGQGPCWVYRLLPQVGAVAPSAHYLGVIVAAHAALGWDATRWRAAADTLPAGRLFVYAALHPTRSNGRLLAGSTRVGPATASGVGWIGAAPSPQVGDGPGAVQGHVWLVGHDLIRELDALDGTKQPRTRRVVKLRGGATAHAYVRAVTGR